MIGAYKDYATALFTLAAEQGNVNLYAIALRTAAEASSAAYLDVLSSPAVPLTERLAMIDEAFGSLPQHVVSCLKLLCEHGHIRSLAACAEEFERLSREAANRTVAAVTSAAPLTDEQKTALCRRLEQVIGKGIDPVYTVDASLIGGVVVEVEGKTYDGSVKHRLHDVKDVMIR